MSDPPQSTHGHPEKPPGTVNPLDKPSTSSHPTSSAPDPTTGDAAGTPTLQAHSQQQHAAQGGLSTTNASASAELASKRVKLREALRQYPDFPSPGILFEDILPIFANPSTHNTLIDALALHVLDTYGESQKPDVIVGLEARGFLFGPSLALRLDAGFVPVRKKGKLPGETITASFKKEYGEDFFQMQADAIKQGQRVIVVDDIIATGGSAAAAGDLIKQLGGTLLGYVFMMELDFLKGRDKLDAPVYTLLSSQ